MPPLHPAYSNDNIWNHATVLCNNIRRSFTHQDFSKNIDLFKMIDSITYILPATILKAETCPSLRDACNQWIQTQSILNELSKLLNKMVDSDYLNITSFNNIANSIQELTAEIEITLCAKRKKLTKATD